MTAPKLTHRILSPAAGTIGRGVGAPSALILAGEWIVGEMNDHALAGRRRR